MATITNKDLKQSIRDYKKKMCPTFSGKKRGELQGIVNRLGLSVKPTGKPVSRNKAVKSAVQQAVEMGKTTLTKSAPKKSAPKKVGGGAFRVGKHNFENKDGDMMRLKITKVSPKGFVSYQLRNLTRDLPYSSAKTKRVGEDGVLDGNFKTPPPNSGGVKMGDFIPYYNIKGYSTD